jgi:pimeloyl-ACP methyl ester carboxylesterase
MNLPTRLDQTCTLADGRRVGLAELGDPAGQPVLLCHGFPASRLECRLMGDAPARLGVRVLALDRPGYGLSDWQEARTIRQWAADVEELAETLGLGRFAVLGVSGGAPYALSLAQALPDRVKAVGIVCGLGPVARPELLKPMHWPARLGFGSARRAPLLNYLFFGGPLGLLMQYRPSAALGMLTVGMQGADREVLDRPDIRASVCDTLREGLRQGTRGALWDMRLYAGDWGFDPATIARPVDFWHGDADATVPVLHTQSVAAVIPGATVRILPDEGHFSLPIRHAEPILERLLSR